MASGVRRWLCWWSMDGTGLIPALILALSGGLFSAAARPGQRLHPYLAQTGASVIKCWWLPRNPLVC